MFSFSMAAIRAERFSGSTQLTLNSSLFSWFSSIILLTIHYTLLFRSAALHAFPLINTTNNRLSAYRRTPGQSPRSAVSKNFFSIGLNTYSAGSLRLSYTTLGRGDVLADPLVGLAGTRHSFDSEFFGIAFGSVL